MFGGIPDRDARREWGHQVWRIDVAPGYRFTPRTQLELQSSLQRGDAPSGINSRTLVAQLALRFQSRLSFRRVAKQ